MVKHMKQFIKIHTEDKEIIINTDMIVSIRIVEDPYYGRFNVRLMGDNETYVVPFEQNVEFYEFVKTLV